MRKSEAFIGFAQPHVYRNTTTLIMHSTVFFSIIIRFIPLKSTEINITARASAK